MSERRDLLPESYDLAQQHPQRRAGERRKRLFVSECLLGEPRQMCDAGVGDEPELGQVRSQGVGGLRVLTHD